MPAPLSKLQKQILAQLARRAFNKAGAVARGRGEEWDESSAHFNEWRHEQVAKACGKAGLRCCDQMDYQIVRGHLLDLLGESGTAFNALVRGDRDNQERLQFRALIYQNIEKNKDIGMTVGYAYAICRNQFKCHFNEASTQQLKNLLFTIRNRATAKRKKAGAVISNQSGGVISKKKENTYV